MPFNFQQSVDVLRQALIASLIEHAERIRSLNAIEPLWAISFDLLPWESFIAISFRLRSESNYPESSNSADWKHSQFISDYNSRTLAGARDFVHEEYHRCIDEQEDDDGRRSQEIAHLIFSAAARALLDEEVAEILRSYGIDAPVVGDTLPWYYFKFYVMDADGVIKANYCDIVCANRVTRRLLGREE